MLNFGVSRILGLMVFMEQDLCPLVFDLRPLTSDLCPQTLDLRQPQLRRGKGKFPSPTTPEILPL